MRYVDDVVSRYVKYMPTLHTACVMPNYLPVLSDNV